MHTIPCYLFCIAFVIIAFVISLLSKKYSTNNIGLYWDDRLSVFKNINEQQGEKHKKIVQKTLKDNGLKIIKQS